MYVSFFFSNFFSISRYDIFYWVIDVDGSWTVSRDEVRTALVGSEERVSDMLRMYPLIRDALCEENVEKSLRDLIPKVKKKMDEVRKEEDEEGDEEDEEGEEDEITFEEFCDWIQGLYDRAKSHQLVDRQLSHLFRSMDKDHSKTLTKKEIINVKILLQFDVKI